MSANCLSLPADPSAVVRLSAFLDCQADAMGNAAFRGGMGNGILPGLLGAAMVIYVAAIGYRLIFNERTDTRFLVMAIVRLGIVIALLTSWSAFSALAQRPATLGPPDLAGKLLGDAEGNLLIPQAYPMRVQGVITKALDVQGMETAATAGTAAGNAGSAPQAFQQPLQPGMPGTPMQPAQSNSMAGADNGKKLKLISDLGDAGWSFVLFTTGLNSAFRLGMGLLLGLSPLFLIAALFDNAQGLFEGWVRAAIGTALAACGSLVSGMLLVQYSEAELARKLASLDNMPPASEILTLNTQVFGLAGIVLSMLGFFIGFRFRLHPGRTPAREYAWNAMAARPSAMPAQPLSVALDVPATSSRTATMVGRVMARSNDGGAGGASDGGRLSLAGTGPGGRVTGNQSYSTFDRAEPARRSSMRKGPGATKREARQ